VGPLDRHEFRMGRLILLIFLRMRQKPYSTFLTPDRRYAWRCLSNGIHTGGFPNVFAVARPGRRFTRVSCALYMDGNRPYPTEIRV